MKDVYEPFTVDGTLIEAWVGRNVSRARRQSPIAAG
jgi:hypothetical protein